MAIGDILAGFAEAGHEHQQTLLRMAYKQRDELSGAYAKLMQDDSYPEPAREQFAQAYHDIITSDPFKLPKVIKKYQDMTISVQPPTPPSQMQPTGVESTYEGMKSDETSPSGQSPKFGLNVTQSVAPAPTPPMRTQSIYRPTPSEDVTNIAAHRAGAIAAAQAPTKPPQMDIGTGTFGPDSSGIYVYDKTDPSKFHIVQQPTPPRVTYQSKTGSIDGKPAVADFDPVNRKYYVGDKDVTGKFLPKESDDTFDEKAYKAWAAKPENKGKSEDDYLAWKSKLAPTAAFNINNPGSEQDAVYIADQVEADPTGLLFARLTGGDKKLKRQVTDELRTRDADLRVLTASTRQLGETAHELAPNFDKAIKMLDSKTLQNKLGALGSRWQEIMAGKVGVGDPEINRLRNFVGLLQTGAMRAHIGARGGVQLQQKFEGLFNSSKMDANTLRDSLTATRDFLKVYEQAVYGTGNANNTVTTGVRNGTIWTKDATGWHDTGQKAQ